MSCINKTLELIAAGLLDPCTMSDAEVISAYTCASERDARVLDALFTRCGSGRILTSAVGFSGVGDQTITITLSASQLSDGFTTDHILGTDLIAVASTKEIWKTDTLSKTPSVIVYRLSGVEDQPNGHQLTAILAKL